MRRIVVSMWTTLDGFVAGPQDEMDWLEVDGRMMEYETSLVNDAEGLLLGRVTHGDFAGAWPAIARDDTEPPESRAYARRVDEMPKFAVSRSGRTADWDTTTRLESLDAETVGRLKEGGSGDLVVYGSLSVVAALQDLGAVDEYQLLVHPTILGEGKPLLAQPVQLALQSVESFSSGVVLMHYAPDQGARVT